MRILEIITVPFFTPRGTAFSALERTKAFSRLGHNVDILAYSLGDDVQIPGVSIHRIPRIPGVQAIEMGPSAKKLVLDLFLAAKSAWWLMTRRYDLVHVHEEAAFWVLGLRPFFHAPVLYDMHSSLVEQLHNFGWPSSGLLASFFEYLERLAILRADGIIVVFPELRALTDSICSAVHVEVIENLPVGWDLPRATPEECHAMRERWGLSGRRVLLYTGNFGRNQGLEMAVEAIARVRREVPEALLVLVGGPASGRERIRRHAELVDCHDGVVLIEPQPYERMPVFMELAEILLSPRAAGTNTPLKIYSYLASGRPIVATRLVTHLQTLDDRTACLVEPSSSGLAHGILRLLRDPAGAERLGAAARELAEERYGIGRYMRQVERILERTCQGREAPGSFASS